MKLAKIASLAVLAATLGQAAFAEEHVVKMLNRGETGVMVFEPAYVEAEVGDTVRFVPTDRAHNAETIEGMLPEGVDMTVGDMSKEVVVTLDKEGVYGIRCKPHYAMGMVALLVAGEPVNLEEAKTVNAPGRADKVFDALLAEAEANT